MKTRSTRILVMTLGIACVVITFVGMRVITGYGFAFHGSFKKVQAGMTEAQVVTALGTANARTTEFRLGQHTGFEKEYARAATSGSAYYLLWYRGLDVVYTVGFDNDRQFTMKVFGGT